MKKELPEKVRISKFLASYNVGSRREIERMIEDGRIHLNGKVLATPVHFVNKTDSIKLDGKLLLFKKFKQIYKFYKPTDCICSKNKQDERKIVYDLLPKKFKNFIFAGRLDVNSEGLLIVTNDGEVARSLELPKNKFIRKYRVRVYGVCEEQKIDNLSKGRKIDGIEYRPFKYKLFNKDKKNFWIEMELKEGKNREIRELMRSIDLRV
ncbi:pseudouridine synthase, partial [Pelagibacteraceae bacterium]|nr:pseudouridine synthase [Pelagibacteraceae bacterium]